MSRGLLLSALFLAACSKGPAADLAPIGEARSLASEWALVNEQAAAGQLDRTYTDTMRMELRQQLRTTASSLTQPNSRYGVEIQGLLAEPADAAPQQLRARAATLKQIEDNLESA
jgi:hypothetical protein